MVGFLKHIIFHQIKLSYTFSGEAALLYSFVSPFTIGENFIRKEFVHEGESSDFKSRPFFGKISSFRKAIRKVTKIIALRKNGEKHGNVNKNQSDTGSSGFAV